MLSLINKLIVSLEFKPLSGIKHETEHTHKMPSYKIETLPLGRTLLGEGPHWDARAQELLYVDIYGKSVHRFDPVTGQERKVVIGEAGEEAAAVSFVIPVQSKPDTYLIAYGGSVSVLEWPAGEEAVHKVSPKMLKTLHSAPAHDPPTTMNDAKCDAKGRLWTGTLCVFFKGSLQNWELVPGVCHLFRLDTDGQFTTHLDGLDLSNGLAWSPDGTQFYFNDSGTARVDAFDYDLTKGTISNRRPAFDFKANNLEGFPDGMCIDADGNLWIAAYGTGKVLHVNPRTGELLGAVEFPGNLKITSCAFGGRDLDELYVTSANFELSEEEKAATPQGPGSLYKVTGLGVKGASAGIAYGGKV